jgi:hypothetical protein
VWFQNRRIKWRQLQYQSTLHKLEQARFVDQHAAAAHAQLQEETTSRANTQYVNGPKDRKKEVVEQAMSPM